MFVDYEAKIAAKIAQLYEKFIRKWLVVHSKCLVGSDFKKGAVAF